MSGNLMYTRHMYPPEGTNQLTERLIAQGIDPMEPGTWPDDVYCVDGEHFVYKWDWIYQKVWEAPCGVQHKGHSAEWGAMYVGGVYHCRENNNPLFRCPHPSKPCPHRLQLPPGINCEFHESGRAYDKALEIDELEREQADRAWRQFVEDSQRHPGYDNPCLNASRGRIRWILYNCLDCRNTCCPARGWAPRDTSPANVFFDLDIERVDETGLIPDVRRTITKGLRVFEKPISRTDAEFALQIWQKDPTSLALPAMMERKLRGYSYEGSDGYGLQLRKRYNHESIHVTVTITNIYVAKQEQRDLIADLQAVRDGAEVIHASDQTRAAKQQKTERRKAAEVDRLARLIANGSQSALWGYQDDARDSKAVRERKRQVREAARAMAAEITAKRERKEAQARARGEQLSMTDLLEG